VYSEEVDIGPCSHKDSQEGSILDSNLQGGESVYSQVVNIGPCSLQDAQENSLLDSNLQGGLNVYSEEVYIGPCSNKEFTGGLNARYQSIER
jgi:hypothetical protein